MQSDQNRHPGHVPGWRCHRQFHRLFFVPAHRCNALLPRRHRPILDVVHFVLRPHPNRHHNRPNRPHHRYRSRRHLHYLYIIFNVIN